jgi:hypothetical protein
MTIEIALGVVLGFILLYFLPYILSRTLIIIPLVVVMVLIFLEIGYISNKWIQNFEWLYVAVGGMGLIVALSGLLFIGSWESVPSWVVGAGPFAREVKKKN